MTTGVRNMVIWMAHYIAYHIQFTVLPRFLHNFIAFVLMLKLFWCVFNMVALLCDHNFVNHYPEEFQEFSKLYVQMVKTNNKSSNIKPHCGLKWMKGVVTCKKVHWLCQRNTHVYLLYTSWSLTFVKKKNWILLYQFFSRLVFIWLQNFSLSHFSDFKPHKN
jgi:hypothetical protein